MEDYQGAINDFTTAIKLDSTYENAYFGRGDAKLNMKDYRGAVKDYTLIIQRKPQNGKGYYKRGMCYILWNKNKDACADLNIAGDLGYLAAYPAIQKFCKVQKKKRKK